MFIPVFFYGKKRRPKTMHKMFGVWCILLILQPKTIILHVCWRHYVMLLATTATNPANFIS